MIKYIVLEFKPTIYLKKLLTESTIANDSDRCQIWSLVRVRLVFFDQRVMSLSRLILALIQVSDSICIQQRSCRVPKCHRRHITELKVVRRSCDLVLLSHRGG